MSYMAEFYKLKPGDNKIRILPPKGEHFLLRFSGPKGFGLIPCVPLPGLCKTCVMIKKMWHEDNDRAGNKAIKNEAD